MGCPQNGASHILSVINCHALLRIVSFDVSLDERSVRERTLGVVRVRIGIVVEQHHGFVLRNDADGCYQLLQFVLQHPLVAGQVDQLARGKIAQQLLAMNALAVSETVTIFSGGALHVLHVALRDISDSSIKSDPHKRPSMKISLI